MKVLALQNLMREEGHIYYRRKFTGEAQIQIPGNTLQASVAFCIETSPLGTKDVEIEVGNAINYPLLPIKKALKQFILEEDQEGKLP
ncbi:MAG: hypothetical protein K2H09_02970 [Treponemataceae bacterium]|nr:hypothetical protein [Treponemataceae bacterium]